MFQLRLCNFNCQWNMKTLNALYTLAISNVFTWNVQTKKPNNNSFSFLFAEFDWETSLSISLLPGGEVRKTPGATMVSPGGSRGSPAWSASASSPRLSMASGGSPRCSCPRSSWPGFHANRFVTCSPSWSEGEQTSWLSGSSYPNCQVPPDADVWCMSRAWIISVDHKSTFGKRKTQSGKTQKVWHEWGNLASSTSRFTWTPSRRQSHMYNPSKFTVSLPN